MHNLGKRSHPQTFLNFNELTKLPRFNAPQNNAIQLKITPSKENLNQFNYNNENNTCKITEDEDVEASQVNLTLDTNSSFEEENMIATDFECGISYTKLTEILTHFYSPRKYYYCFFKIDFF